MAGNLNIQRAFRFLMSRPVKTPYDNLMMNLIEGRAHALLEGNDIVAVIAWNKRQETTQSDLWDRKRSC